MRTALSLGGLNGFLDNQEVTFRQPLKIQLGVAGVESSRWTQRTALG